MPVSQKVAFALDRLEELAKLVRTKNTVEDDIAGIIGRPALIGHVGEFIASQVFRIKLHNSATTKGSDGVFERGPLAGKTVNVKWYPKREGLLDISLTGVPDYYLILAGPKAPAAPSRGATRPWSIESIFLFEARTLLAKLRERGVKVGAATSVRVDQWEAAEVYPRMAGFFRLDKEQRKSLKLFSIQGLKIERES